MQVLMTELATDRARTAAALLETRAHEIVTCGDDVPRTVTCAALRGGSCPLDRQTIDVVLHVERADGPGLADEGVVCALRRFVPLVVAARGQASSTSSRRPSPKPQPLHCRPIAPPPPGGEHRVGKCRLCHQLAGRRTSTERSLTGGAHQRATAGPRTVCALGRTR